MQNFQKLIFFKSYEAHRQHRGDSLPERPGYLLIEETGFHNVENTDIFSTSQDYLRDTYFTQIRQEEAENMKRLNERCPMDLVRFLIIRIRR